MYYRQQREPLRNVERRIVAWMEIHGHRMLRYSLGIVLLWFGALKYLGPSRVTEIAAGVVPFIPASIWIPLLATWEIAIGICLLHRPFLRLGIALMMLQMAGTFLPLVMLPQVTWVHFPYEPTFEGQYIIKNLVLVSAGLVVGGTILHRQSNVEE
jgi:uncharacterized membrane protein YkgB